MIFYGVPITSLPRIEESQIDSNQMCREPTWIIEKKIDF